MDTWYLGYCIRCPDGSRTGKIQPLARLRSVDGKLVADGSRDLSEFGPSGMVFWDRTPAPLQDLTQCVVQFRCHRTAEYDDTSTSRDWQKVARIGSKWDCKRAGFRLVELGTEAEWREEPRWVIEATEGELVFVWDKLESKVTGPWRVGKRLPDRPDGRELTPRPGAAPVRRYSIVPQQESIFQEDVQLTGGRKRLRFLLDLPDESRGEPVDLFTPRQLANWLIEQIKRAAPALIVRLDQESPGWRKRIREEVEGYSDSGQELDRGRWERLEAILDTLVLEAEQIDSLLQHDKLHARFDAAVASRREDEVLRKSAEIETEAENLAAGHRARLEGEIASLETRKSTLESEVTRLEARRSEQDRREKLLRELSEHLDKSRDRLVLDAAALQPLLESRMSAYAESNGQAVASESGAPASALVAPPADGSPIDAPRAFIDLRLWPALHAWLPGTPRGIAEVLHCAVAGCRATLVPNPAWAKAYAEAFGGSARLTIVTVEPTWLGFADLWRGGLGDCWERAVQSPNIIELVLLRDFNRSLPQCYARPLLDLLAGFSDRLPAPGRGGWPATLRLFACPAPTSEALPLTSEVTQHFGAIRKEPAASADDVPSDMNAGHVRADTWLHWSGSPPAAFPLGIRAKEFGPLVRTAAIEVAAVSGSLQQLGQKGRDADEPAIDIRVNNPAEYTERSGTAGGLGR
jgi:hypothetical protein